ncbi:MAG TPA: ROK family protein, partial [Galbitalea sp.]
MAKAVGIDIGGTGIKGALVDTETGELLSDRLKLDTPEG